MAAMGRKPKPTGLRVLQGNPGHRPINDREPRLSSEHATEPPTGLSPQGAEEWARLAPGLVASRVLTDADRATLAIYCEAWATWRDAQMVINEMAARDRNSRGLMIKSSNGNLIENPLVGTARRAAQEVLRCAAELGITPSARSRVTVVPGPSPDNPFAAIRAKRERAS